MRREREEITLPPSHPARKLPKWKKDVNDLTVGVGYDERRGAQAYFPKPIAEHLAKPKSITYSIKSKRVEVRAEED